jgi:hypothetical protein
MNINLYDELSRLSKIRIDDKRNAVVFAMTEDENRVLSESSVIDSLSEYDYRIIKYSPEKFEKLYNEKPVFLKDISYLLYINYGVYEKARLEFLERV